MHIYMCVGFLWLGQHLQNVDGWWVHLPLLLDTPPTPTLIIFPPFQSEKAEDTHLI